MKNILALPLSYIYEEHGGYDCMSSSYNVLDANGKLIFRIDVVDVDDTIGTCQNGENEKAESIARYFVELANKN
jgi:hypothetical protein